MTISALFGTFNERLDPIDTVDITKYVMMQQRDDGSIALPRNMKSMPRFQSDAPGHKYVQVDFGGDRHHVLLDNYFEDVSLRAGERRKIIVVHDACINDAANWKTIVEGQIRDLQGYGLLNDAKLHVTVSDTKQRDEVYNFVAGVCGPTADIQLYRDNHSQFWGLNEVWKLGHQEPDAIIGYLHAKGMENGIQARDKDERVLTDGTFLRWRRALQIFDKPEIDRAGMFPCRTLTIPPEGQVVEGFMLGNFFWAKGEHIRGHKKPEMTERPDDLQQWLGDSGVGTKHDSSMSFYSGRPTLFTPEIAASRLAQLSAG